MLSGERAKKANGENERRNGEGVGKEGGGEGRGRACRQRIETAIPPPCN